MSRKSRSDAKKSTNVYLWLILILVLGLSVRLYHINSQSIWTDEAIATYTALRDFKYVATNTAEPTPPLYFITLFFWIKLFGSSEFALRLLSIIISSISIFLIYLLASTIYDKRTGLISALILALSPIHISYAQEIRSYSLLILFSILSTYYYVKLLKGKHGMLRYLPYIIASTLLVYTHIFGIFLLIAHAIHYIFSQRKIVELIKIYGAIVLLYLPWLIIMPQVFAKSWSSVQIGMKAFGLSSLKYVFYEFAFGRVFPTFSIIMLILYAYLLAKYIFSKDRNPVLLLWAIIPLLVSFILSSIFSMYLLVRYVLIASIPMIIIIAHSINFSAKKFSNIFLILLLLTSGICIYMQQNTVTKDPWRDISAYIKDNPASQVAVVAYYEVFPFTYYYDKYCMETSTGHEQLYECLRNRNKVYATKHLTDVDYLESDEIILVTSRVDTEIEGRKILEGIYSKYDVVESKTFYSYQDNIKIRTFLTKNMVDTEDVLFNQVEVVRMKLRQ